MSSTSQGTGTRTPESHSPESSGSNGAKLAIAWTLVGVPLAYGISQTIIRASQLFTG